jgi:hypothetical protein
MRVRCDSLDPAVITRTLRLLGWSVGTSHTADDCRRQIARAEAARDAAADVLRSRPTRCVRLKAVVRIRQHRNLGMIRSSDGS